MGRYLPTIKREIRRRQRNEMTSDSVRVYIPTHYYMAEMRTLRRAA